MKLRHTAAWVGFTAVTLLAASACGTEGARSAAKAVSNGDKIMAALARATDRTEKVGSAQVRMVTNVGTGKPISMDGTYSWGHGYAFDVQMDTKAANMQSVQDDPTIRTLLVDGAYYYDVDPLPSGPYKGKEWMKVDSSAVLGEKGSQALRGDNGSPSASMKGLKYANDVEDLGSQTVNGQRTTHYRAVIDQAHMGKFKEAYGGKDSAVGSLTGGTTSITMDVWVGPKDLPVRLKEKFGAGTVTMDFDKFGDTATITAPPASQTADVTELLKKQRQG
ncbi:hypothetical protein ACWCQN_19365 [Streptomyces sp. NPDC001984]|uniref:hypothetical protein n=1 Tax=Streptomyces sp. NPDC002619 TaxID=3364655 RepID=UPI0036C08EE5